MYFCVDFLFVYVNIFCSKNLSGAPNYTYPQLFCEYGGRVFFIFVRQFSGVPILHVPTFFVSEYGGGAFFLRY